ncbi:MAG TPA: zf-HC2 domain-containing protein [Pirellulales bacterium]|jgi:anti-sigma factor RsiW
MRCQELSELILLLVYDELGVADQALVEEHLASCPACRAELSALQATQRLLDLTPARQTQVDLAAVCLRIADRERRSRAWRRWGLGVTSLAASLVALAAVRLLHVEFAPGHVVVAWRQPSPVPPEPAEAPAGQGGGAADIQYAATERAATDGPDSAVSPVYRFDSRKDVVESALLDSRGQALMFSTARGGSLPGASWDARRYAQPITDATRAADRAMNYGDLRRELLDEERVDGPTRNPRGA